MIGKYIRIAAIALVAVTAPLAMTSCGNDEPNVPNGGNGNSNPWQPNNPYAPGTDDNSLEYKLAGRWQTTDSIDGKKTTWGFQFEKGLPDVSNPGSSYMYVSVTDADGKVSEEKNTYAMNWTVNGTDEVVISYTTPHDPATETIKIESVTGARLKFRYVQTSGLSELYTLDKVPNGGADPVLPPLIQE